MFHIRDQRFSAVCCAALATAAWWCSAAAARDVGIISEAQANRIGLSVHWTSQVEASNLNDVVAAVLAVDENDATTFFEITGGRVREVVSQRDIAPNGRPFGTGAEGLAQARAYAELRREMLQTELNARGIEETVALQEMTLPRTTVYVATRTGAVQAFDAETGRQLWRASVGELYFDVVGLAASPRFVAVVLASSVYCLDAKTGKVLWQQRCSHAVTANPTFSDNYVFVPLWDGHLQAFPLDNNGRGHRYLTSRGVPLYAATLAGNDLGWSTDLGTFNVADVEEDLRLLFRLRMDSRVVGSAIYRYGHFFLATLNGHVYAIDTRRQKLMWSSGLGETVSTSPVVVGENIFVFTNVGKLFKLAVRTGAVAEGWHSPPTNIYRFVGASDNHIFVQDGVGDLVMIDQQSGSRLGAIGYRGTLKTLNNHLTDRLYICHAGGAIQCLREIANVNPIYHVDEARSFHRARQSGDDGGDNAAPIEEDDPFRGLDDRFRRGGQEQRDDSDPFRRGGG